MLVCDRMSSVVPLVTDPEHRWRIWLGWGHCIWRIAHSTNFLGYPPPSGNGSKWMAGCGSPNMMGCPSPLAAGFNGSSPDPISLPMLRFVYDLFGVSAMRACEVCFDVVGER